MVSSTPISTPTVDTTSVARCLPSADSDGDRSRAPMRIRYQAQSALSTVAAAETPRPTTSGLNGRGATKPSHAFERIRVDRDRSGEPRCDDFEREHDQPDGETAERHTRHYRRCRVGCHQTCPADRAHP